MTRDEEEQLTSLISSNPGLQVTPQVLIQFIAMQTTTGDNQSPDPSPPPQSSPDEFDYRGRMEERDYDGYNSRSSSRDSTATYHRSSSRGPPATPRESVFDSGRRQRTTPLNNNAPSSWTRRPPPSRRKSDAGQGHNRALSDSEVRTFILYSGVQSGQCSVPRLDQCVHGGSLTVTLHPVCIVKSIIRANA